MAKINHCLLDRKQATNVSVRIYIVYSVCLGELEFQVALVGSLKFGTEYHQCGRHQCGRRGEPSSGQTCLALGLAIEAGKLGDHCGNKASVLLTSLHTKMAVSPPSPPSPDHFY